MRSLLLLALVTPSFSSIMLDSCAPDNDWDDVSDDTDNCVDLYNPEQADEDGDNNGDACDGTTPWHDIYVDGCYLSDWPPLRGVNWEDRPTLIQQGDVDRTRLAVAVDWTASSSDWVESGEGSTNGLGVWFDIRDEHNPYNYTRTMVEGEAVDTNGDGEADEIHGTYVMLVCDDPEGQCDLSPDYEYFADGEWHAVRTNSTECRNL